MGGGGKTAKAAAKWPSMIEFQIFKCLWNHLIKMPQLGGQVGGQLKQPQSGQKLLDFKCLWNHLIKTLLVGGSGGVKQLKQLSNGQKRSDFGF